MQAGSGVFYVDQAALMMAYYAASADSHSVSWISSEYRASCVQSSGGGGNLQEKASRLQKALQERGITLSAEGNACPS